MQIGNRTFDTKNKTYIMGILNVTPDSFSDGGKWVGHDSALSHAEDMIRDGADIIDIGGESTRPGYKKISIQEEIDRILPVVAALKARFDVPLSIDTYKSQVAEVALKEGVHMVNDIWGLKYDPNMAPLIAKYNAACCLVHNTKEAAYENLVESLITEIGESIHIASASGVSKNKIMMDPGIGFGKTHSMNLKIINELELLHKPGYPILLGTSRKSFIGEVLNLTAEQRMEGTLVTTVMAVMKGCAFVRVHDVKENKRVIQMTEAILETTDLTHHKSGDVR